MRDKVPEGAVSPPKDSSTRILPWIELLDVS
jgi:hypothetical protein